jgi:hypothetical protein
MIILTYPRSGSHYLRALASQKLKILLPATHLADDAKGFVITVARNPYDTLHSFISMSFHYNQEIGIQSEIDKYTRLCRLLYNKANIVIDYDTMIKTPDTVVSMLSDILDKPVVEHKFEQNMKDRPEEVYLVSSTTSEQYRHRHLDGFDLTDAENAYNLLLSRKII